MHTIVVPGALRAGSLNLKLARAMASLAPAGHTFEVVTLHGIPLYDGDEEAKSFPPAVTTLKEKVAAADALLLVSPEYNNGIPGVMKNGIDWMTRPPADIARVFRGRPTGLVGATPGSGGTRLAQTAWLPIFRTLGVLPYFGQGLYVEGASKVFDDAGAIVDEKTKARVNAYVEGFATFVASSTSKTL